MVRPGCLIALAGLLLGACEGGPFGGRTPVMVLEAPKQAQSSQTSDAAEAEAAVPAKPPVPRRKPHAHDETLDVPTPGAPADVVGMDFTGVRALLGDPALELEEPPAKVWAYNGGSCMFNVFFFPSLEDNVYRVLTFEVTGPVQPAADGRTPNPLNPTTVKIKDPKDPALQECFEALLQGRATSSSDAQ